MFNNSEPPTLFDGCMAVAAVLLITCLVLAVVAFIGGY